MINLTRLLIIFISYYSAASQSILKTLPGYSGDLPFELETGYVTVGRNDDIELFYYFIESERNPKEDPLILWLAGGPGETGLTGLVFEIGPFAFDFASFNGSLPSLVPRQHSWTKVASVIFIDQPVGVGFSYGTQGDHYNTSDIVAAKDTYSFLRKWLLNHPMFIKNDLYIGGVSYGGKIVPIIVLEIVNGNEAGLEPQMSLQGYLVGNPITDENAVSNERIPYAHGMALISTEYYESAKSRCSGQYVNPDPNNLQCLNALKLVNNCLRDISTSHILEPPCSENHHVILMLLEDNWLDILLSSKQDKKICRDDMKSAVSYVWANSQEVQDALNIRKGTIKEWKRGIHLAYTEDVASAVPYHQALNKKIRKAMVYSGDHDITAPYIAPLKWMQHFNLTMDDRWRSWHVNGEVAGYTQRYKKDEYSLTYTTVKGAGHAAPEYNPEQCLAMLDRWFSSNAL